MEKHIKPSLLSHLRKRIVVRRLGSYVRGEQSDGARRETAYLIDRDDSVYAEFRRVKDADRSLSADLAPHGRPERAQLDRAFANIGAALNGAAPLYRLRRMPDWRASIVAIALGALMLVPVAVSFNRVAAIGIATQPQPRAAIEDNITPTGESPVVASLTTLTPELATARFISRATPTAPESQ